jgi:hypothetical protein
MRQAPKYHKLYEIEAWRDARRLRALDEFDETNHAKSFAKAQKATDLYMAAWHRANGNCE